MYKCGLVKHNHSHTLISSALSVLLIVGDAAAAASIREAQYLSMCKWNWAVATVPAADIKAAMAFVERSGL